MKDLQRVGDGDGVAVGVGVRASVLMTCCTLHSVWVVSVIFKSVLHGKRQRYPIAHAPYSMAGHSIKCRTIDSIETWISPVVVVVVVVVNCLSTIILLCCQHLNVIMPIILFYDSPNIFVEAHIFRASNRSSLPVVALRPASSTVFATAL